LRGNLELAAVVADEASDAQLAGWRRLTPEEAPVNTPDEFLAFCGVLGLGRVLVRGEGDVQHGGGGTPPLRELRAFAADPRWRTREAVAMALQRWGDADMAGLLAEMRSWAAADDLLVRRAAIAALCEPRLLRDPDHAAAVLSILDDITSRLNQIPPSARKSDAFKILRQALGYGWSVAIVAAPERGKALLEKWLAFADPDVRWIMRENLKKNRLQKMDPGWAAYWQAITAGPDTVSPR
jgi:hypothetical protein